MMDSNIITDYHTMTKIMLYSPYFDHAIKIFFLLQVDIQLIQSTLNDQLMLLGFHQI